MYTAGTIDEQEILNLSMSDKLNLKCNSDYMNFRSVRLFTTLLRVILFCPTIYQIFSLFLSVFLSLSLSFTLFLSLSLSLSALLLT